MNKDIYLTIIEDLKTAHQEEINRLKGKLIAHEICDDLYNRLQNDKQKNRIINELKYDIKMFILSSDDKYAILWCFELYDKNMYNNCEFLKDHIFKDLIQYKYFNFKKIKSDTYDTICDILITKCVVKKLYLMFGEEFYTKNIFDKYVYTDLEKEINDDHNHILGVASLCTYDILKECDIKVNTLTMYYTYDELKKKNVDDSTLFNLVQNNGEWYDNSRKID